MMRLSQCGEGEADKVVNPLIWKGLTKSRIPQSEILTPSLIRIFSNTKCTTLIVYLWTWMTFMVVIAKEYQETVFPFGNILITIWLVSVNLCLIQVDNYGFYNFAEKFEVWNPILGGKWQISSLWNILIFKLIIQIFISVNICEYIRIIIIRISSLLYGYRNRESLLAGP